MNNINQQDGNRGDENINNFDENFRTVLEMNSQSHSDEDIAIENSAERDFLLDSQEGSSSFNPNTNIDDEDTTGNNNINTNVLNHEQTGFRTRTNRYIGMLGKHFNILDRVFQRPTEINGQHGATYDGVFSNLTAKPHNGSSAEVPDEDFPPTYNEAATDVSPSYYGVNSDGAAMYYDEICIEGLPVGNIANLIWNIIVSTSFQFIGFLITYVLHTSHAAKQGSRFGLGLTFIGYSYSMIPNDVTSKVGKGNILDRVQVANPNDYDNLEIDSQHSTQDTFRSTLSHGVEEEKKSLPFLAVVVGALGLYISIKSILDYIKVKRMEKKYLSQEQTA